MSPERVGLANQLLQFNEALGRIEREQHNMRQDIRELRQEVGLSLPPSGKVDARSAQRAWFHLRVSLRYAVVAGAGAAGAWFAEWLASLLH